MKIVIDIPESVIDRAKGKDGLKLCDIDIKFICNQVANGTPLPKGHGDLIDRDELRQSVKENLIDTSNLHYENLVEAEGVNCGVESSLDDVNNAPIVIPADKGE